MHLLFIVNKNRKDIKMNEVVIKIRELVLENAEIEDNLDITFDNLDGLIEAFGSYDTLVNFIIKTIKEGRNEKN